MRYIIVSFNRDGSKIIPIPEYDENDMPQDYMKEFTSFAEAEAYAESVPICQAHGYEIVELEK
jgi:hypothetical protein